MNDNRTIYDDVDVISGVGQKRKDSLRELGITTIDDLLTYYPFRYQDISESLPSQTKDGQKTTFKGVVATPPILSRFGKKNRLNFKLSVDNQVVEVTFFNQPWLQNTIKQDDQLAIYGTYNAAMQSLTANKIIKKATDELESIYPVNKSIKQNTLKQLIVDAFGLYADKINNLIPQRFIDTYHLVDRKTQIENIHFPKNLEDAQIAKRSAIFEEFFLYQMKLKIIQQSDASNFGRAFQFDENKIKQMINNLPYQLTSSQIRVIDEILTDLKKPIHMNRLLQGDVGSGKTIVAAIAIYAAYLAGVQVALMAPTEILANQLAQNVADTFDQLGVDIRIELLTGSTKAAGRKEILKSLADGSIDVIVGTHALIQKGIEFHNLGLAIIDEQHRFGVNQRAILREIGQNPDVLAMSATPIPRTLTITAYGEMQISVIDELPKGRKKIITRAYQNDNLDQLYDWIFDQLKNKVQIYVVTPLIEESEVLDLQNATELYQEFQSRFPDFKIALIHGRLKNEEKNAIMSQFKNGEIQLLVSTSVIEVGVDVPNASVIVIMDADRFGLAQLHQLRGRVGRGEKQSYAILVANPKTEYGKERLNALVESNDGFVIAQKDLELRGPGDVLGVQQSGVPVFSAGDPVKDLKIMEVAQSSAETLVNQKGWEQQPDCQFLVEYLSNGMEKFRNFD